MEEGVAHATLVFDGDDAIAWCEYGSPVELPNIYHRKQHDAGETMPASWRIICFFVDRDHRRSGVARQTLDGPLKLIAQAGCGEVVSNELLNPSTVDAAQLDPTLRRCVGFTKRDGYGGMVILNVYASCTKSPSVMMAATDPVGPDHDGVLAAATGTVVAGWGTDADPARVVRALTLLQRLHALAVTKDGHPRHPLYVPADAPLIAHLGSLVPRTPGQPAACGLMAVVLCLAEL